MPVERTRSWEKSFNTARAFALGAINSGWSFAEFYSEATEAGFSYRRQRMLADWRSLQNVYNHESQLQSLQSSTVVPDSYVTREMYARNYSYIVGFDYDYTDPVTGAKKTGWVGVTSNELESVGDYTVAAWALIGEGGAYYNPTAANLRIRYVIGKE